MRPHRQHPTRLPHPWDSPGKNTGVGCHFLLQSMKVKSEKEVAQSSCHFMANRETMERVRGFIFLGSKITADGDCSHEIKRRLLLERKAMTNLAAKSLQSCPTLCNPIDSIPPGSPIPGILQARTLEWVCHFLLQCMKSEKWK